MRIKASSMDIVFFNESKPTGFSIPLCAVFGYVREFYWYLALLRSRCSLSAVCRSKSSSLCAPSFSVGLQCHLVKKEKREPIVSDTVTRQFLSSWPEAWCGTIKVEQNILWVKILSFFCRGDTESWGIRDRADCIWGKKRKYGLPQQQQPSSPKCECSAAASCVCPWHECTQWYQEPDNLSSGGAGVGWQPLPLNAPEKRRKVEGIVYTKEISLKSRG